MKSIIALALAVIGLSTIPAQAGGRCYSGGYYGRGHTVAVLNTRLHYGYRTCVRPVVRYAAPCYSNYGYGYGGGYYGGYAGYSSGYCRPVYRGCGNYGNYGYGGYRGYAGYGGCGYGGYAGYGGYYGGHRGHFHGGHGHGGHGHGHGGYAGRGGCR